MRKELFYLGFIAILVSSILLIGTVPAAPPSSVCTPCGSKSCGTSKCIGINQYQCQDGQWLLAQQNVQACGYVPPTDWAINSWNFACSDIHQLIYTVPAGKILQIHDVILTSSSTHTVNLAEYVKVPAGYQYIYFVWAVPVSPTMTFSHKYSNIVLNEGEQLYGQCDNPTSGYLEYSLTGTLINK